MKKSIGSFISRHKWVATGSIVLCLTLVFGIWLKISSVPKELPRPLSNKGYSSADEYSSPVFEKQTDVNPDSAGVGLQKVHCEYLDKIFTSKKTKISQLPPSKLFTVGILFKSDLGSLEEEEIAGLLRKNGINEYKINRNAALVSWTENPKHTEVVFDGTVKKLQNLFHVELVHYFNTLIFWDADAPDRTPSIDLDVPVLTVRGLANEGIIKSSVDFGPKITGTFVTPPCVNSSQNTRN